MKTVPNRAHRKALRRRPHHKAPVSMAARQDPTECHLGAWTAGYVRALNDVYSLAQMSPEWPLAAMLDTLIGLRDLGGPIEVHRLHGFMTVVSR